MSQKVILIGYMGSGKTTLGKKIAKELKIPFIDSDREIVELTKKSIAQIFSEEGEDFFRKLESEFIESLKGIPNFILSTGGGMPCFNDNITSLNKMGNTIYLKHSSEGLANRLINSKNERPLIQDKSMEELIHFIDVNLLVREKYYNQASITLKAGEQGLINVLNLIDNLFKKSI